MAERLDIAAEAAGVNPTKVADAIDWAEVLENWDERKIPD